VPKVRFGSLADIEVCPRDVRFVPKADMRSSPALFDDFVSAGDQSGDLLIYVIAPRDGGANGTHSF
jgi:hypothetical protein